MFRILISFALIQFSLAQQCFDLGQCKNSIALGATTADSTNQCLQLCKETSGCEYLTFDHTNGACLLYTECTSLGTEECEQCLSGPVNCNYIECGIPGQCVGILEYQQTAQTKTDCEADAFLYGDIATWYTYNNADLLCLMFSECQDFSDALCPDCVSGNPACIIEEDLPPLPTTTSTNPTTTTPYPPESCPDGWEWNPDTRKCYYLIDEDMSWTEANEMCIALDPEAALTSILSQDENDFIQSFTNGAASWIGGNDIAEEGVWRWVDDDTLVETSFTNWDETQPDNTDDNQNCMRMGVTWEEGAWDDYYCNDHPLPYAVCSKRIAAAAVTNIPLA